VSTADATFAAEGSAEPRRPVQRFGRIIVVGGGCYGSYYVRQLGRAERAGAVAWDELVIVDRDGECSVARLPVEARPPRTNVVVADWRAFFSSYLGSVAGDAGSGTSDAIVPSPLMPHLMADWLTDRAHVRWPRRGVRIEPLGGDLAVPWQRTGDDGTHYASFAEWMCPINCIEPSRCPETRGVRDWSMPVALRRFAEGSPDRASRPEPLLFHCVHRAYGVGMIDVRDVLAADAAVAASARAGSATFLVGTVSHCHGALRRLTIDAPP
jgi:hypothetical protein